MNRRNLTFAILTAIALSVCGFFYSFKKKSAPPLALASILRPFNLNDFQIFIFPLMTKRLECESDVIKQKLQNAIKTAFNPVTLERTLSEELRASANPKQIERWQEVATTSVSTRELLVAQAADGLQRLTMERLRLNERLSALVERSLNLPSGCRWLPATEPVPFDLPGYRAKLLKQFSPMAEDELKAMIKRYPPKTHPPEDVSLIDQAIDRTALQVVQAIQLAHEAN